jgi:hypothetical protein
MTETDVVIIEVNNFGVIQVRASIEDAPFLNQIQPAISKFDTAIQRACKTAGSEDSTTK